MLVLSVIDVFNMFDNVQIMTGGGPSGATETMVLYAYDQAYTFLNYGYAITLSCLTFLCVFILTAIQMSIGGDNILSRKDKKKVRRLRLRASQLKAKEE